MTINTIKYLTIRINTIISTLFNILIIKYFSKIEMGNGCSFNGRMHVWKFPKSKIKIGSKCTFISNSWTRNLVGINRPCIINTMQADSTIIIGKNCGFSGTVLSSALSISIGDNVKCGANTQIMDSDWHPEDPRSGNPRAVIIGDNVWLGLNVLVMKGVTIGENSVIGANSVVTKSIPANVIAAGNPCKIIRYLQIDH